ncbi:MAG: hypothetical protein ACPG7F_16185, partial [Aggregatilineales bacterium]
PTFTLVPITSDPIIGVPGDCNEGWGCLDEDDIPVIIEPEDLCKTVDCLTMTVVTYFYAELEITMRTFDLWLTQPDDYVFEVIYNDDVIVSALLGEDPVNLIPVFALSTDTEVDWNIRATATDTPTLSGVAIINQPPVVEVTSDPGVALLKATEATALYRQWEFEASAQATLESVNSAINAGNVEDVYRTTRLAGLSLPFITLIDGLENPVDLTTLIELNSAAAEVLQLPSLLDRYSIDEAITPFSPFPIAEFSVLPSESLFQIPPGNFDLVDPAENFSEIYFPDDIDIFNFDFPSNE